MKNSLQTRNLTYIGDGIPAVHFTAYHCIACVISCCYDYVLLINAANTK